MSDKFPFVIFHFGVNFTNSAFPYKVSACFLVPPMCIDINNCECGIAFFRHFDFYCVPLISNQIVVIKYILPILAPTDPIEMPQFKDPISWVVSIRMGRPWPNHIGMNDRKE